METLTQYFLSVSIWFQQFPTWLNPIMKGITFLGNVEFYLLIMPLLYWCIDLSLGIRMGILLLVSGVINALLKLGFQAPRPFWVSDLVVGYSEGTSFGFPSGHSQNAASIWGLLMVSVQKRWVKILALLGIILIGISRLVLGVHFLHDVLAGWLIGAGLVYAFIHLEPAVSSWYSRNTTAKRLLMMGFVTAIFILLPILISPPFDFPVLPENWIKNAGTEINPYSYDDILTSTGSFLGLGLGIIMLGRKGTFVVEGKIWQLFLRYLIGVAGVLLFWAGLKSLFPDDISPVSYILRFIRYGLVGLWISFGAPVLFSSIKLSEIKKA